MPTGPAGAPRPFAESGIKVIYVIAGADTPVGPNDMEWQDRVRRSFYETPFPIEPLGIEHIGTEFMHPEAKEQGYDSQKVEMVSAGIDDTQIDMEDGLEIGREVADRLNGEFIQGICKER